MLGVIGWGCAAAAQPVPQPSYFGTKEIRREGLKPFTKWTRVLDRHPEDERAVPRACAQNPGKPCPWNQWRQFIDQARDMPPLQRLDAVNRFMNRHRYVTDIVNWGVEDYWETPNEFVTKDGDCEDFAIAKYYSLRAMGVEQDSLRIVVLQDLNLRVGHAVLVVLVDGKAWVLDNQVERVIEADRIRHYKPYYSLNEKSFWLHR